MKTSRLHSLISLIVLLRVLAAASTHAAAPVGIMVPAYFYPDPGGYWHAMSNAATRVPLTAILNPSDGPGTSQDFTYFKAITNLQSVGGQVLGYVATGYSSSNSATVKAQIDSYLAWYPVDGIMLDEMSNDSMPSHIAFYADIYQFIKNRNPALFVVGNPGSQTAETYLTKPAADTLILFEDENGYPGFQPDAWVSNYSAQRFVHLAYTVPDATTMSNYVQLARQRNAGWVYITDDDAVNPWDTLPGYWLDEVEFIHSLNLTAPPFITRQPVGRTVAAGSNVTFTVKAAGPAPMGYQWLLNDAAIGNSTNATLQLGSAQPANAGNYSVVVSNPFGSATSQVAALTVETSLTRLTNSVIETTASSAYSLSWMDYDNDGYLDLLFVGRLGGIFLFHNNGDGTFSKINNNIVQEPGNTDGGVWGDFNNDGKMDLLLAKTGAQPDAMFTNNGNGTFTRVYDIAGGLNDYTAAWADYDNDGFLDLFLPASFGQNNILYHNQRDGTFTPVAPGNVTSDGTWNSSATWGDFNNDGYLDLFVPNDGNSSPSISLLYRNDGGTNFTQVSRGDIGIAAGVSLAAAWGDYDNDGDLDLYVANYYGPNFLFRNDGNGAFTRITNGVFSTEGDSVNCTWGDFDNDGCLDLFVGNRTGGCLFYRNNGDGTFSRITNGILATDTSLMYGGVWGDFDRDGFLDLAVSGANDRLYHNNGNSNAWLNVRSVGLFSNRAAIGAKVRVQARIGGATRWQMREVSGGFGLGLQNIESNFGLGDATNVDTLRIEWPSGILQEFHNVAPRRFLTIQEPAVCVTVNGQLSRSNLFMIPATNSVLIALPTVFTNASVFFTLDGSEPSGGDSYTGPFSVTNSVVVRAIAYNEDFSASSTNDAVRIDLVPLYPLSFSTPGGGSVSANPPVNTFVSNSVVTLTATPLAGWQFINWTGDATGTNPMLNLTMDRARNAQAIFGTPLFVTAAGSGTVTREPENGPYPYGSTNRLTPTPNNATTYFRQWGGAANGQFAEPLDFVISNASPTVSAVFASLPLNTHSLTISNFGMGSVTKTPQQSNYAHNASVTLTAMPVSGWTFMNWSGDTNSGLSSLSLVMDTNKFIVANFEPQSTSNAPPVANLTAPAAGTTFTNPSVVTLVATASDPEGSLARVEFFAGSGFLGSVANTPFQLAWTNPPVASHLLRAVAVDQPGARGTSAPVSITVRAPVNQAPLVSIVTPTNNASFTSGTNITITASAADQDGSVARVEFLHGATNLIGVASNGVSGQFSVLWSNVSAGSYSLTGRAFDNQGASGDSAGISVTVVNGTAPAPLFSFATNSYTAGESAGSVTVTILKNAGSPAASVNFFTANGTALAGQDFEPTNVVLAFGAAQTSRTVTIPIYDDFIVEGIQYFLARISPLDAGTVVTNDTATIAILDNDATTNSYLSRGVTPIINPATLPTLQVNLLQTNQQPLAPGQWRFVWESNWRNNGSVAGGLPAGDYEIEFKPVPGYLEPLRTIVSLTAPAQFNFFYTNTSLPQIGSLMVALDPPFIAGNPDPNFHGGWRLEGESAYRDGGTQLDGISAGSYVVQFKTVTNLWVTPSPRVVSVPANRLTTITARYSVAATNSSEAPGVLGFTGVNGVNGSFSVGQPPNAIGFPYVFCGQLQTDAGWGSGCAVKERVVLTAGHVVFDDEALSFVPGVNWFFQRHVGVYEPPPRPARGWVALTGYADARTNDITHGGTPGVSNVASKNRDVAALYFLNAAAGGGFSGYVVSRTPAGEWLFNASSETLVGYPVEIVPEANRGRMHRTSPISLSWITESNQVFYTTDIVGYPGMSGGPLCVQLTTNGQTAYFPAAVFLGGNGRTTVRAIDSEVADLINLAESLGDSGQNNTGGGPIRFGAGGAVSLAFEGVLTVQVFPPEMTNYGAAYRFVSATDISDFYYDQFNYFRTFGGGLPYTLEFKPLPYFIAPTNRVVTFVTGTTNTVVANYQAYGTLEALAGSTNARLWGSSGSVYRIEYRSSLGGTAPWTLLRTQRLTGSSALVTNVFPPGTAIRFVRAGLQP